MKETMFRRSRKPLATLSFLCVFAATSASATVVTWNLNPTGTEGAVGSASKIFTASGYSTANGYSLGIVGPSTRELQGNGWNPTQFIQFDVGSIIDQEFADGKLQIGSVQGSSNDTFVIGGSSSLGDRGTQIGDVYTSSSDMLFVNMANFTDYDFISIGALSCDVLPIAFPAILTAVPEMSAFFPIVGLLAAIAITQILRRRRIAQLRAGSPGGH